MSLRLKWDTAAIKSIVSKWPDESAKEFSGALTRIGQQYRRAMFDRFKAPTSGPPFNRNTSPDMLKTRSGALRGTVGYSNTRSKSVKDLRLVLFVGDGATKHYARIQETGGVVKPTRSRFLTLPLPDNLTAAGVPRFPSARALFEQYPKRVWIQKSQSGYAIIKYRPAEKLFGRDVLNLWILKTSVRLKPRLGFAKTVKDQHGVRIKELRDALARTLRGVRSAAKGGDKK